MNKDEIESVFRKVGCKPAQREKYGNYEIYYGTGTSMPPHLVWASRENMDDFPLGAFVTFYWVGKDEKLFFGRPLFHNLTELSESARINAARADAHRKLDTLNGKSG
jgi:hypothetical protein